MQQDVTESGEAVADPVNLPGKKKKPEKKAVEANVFFNFKPQVESWADVVDDSGHSAAADINTLRSRLPAAPRVCREEEMEARAPHSPPFQIRMSNVPFDATENQVRNFLSGLSVTRIMMDRGSAIVEFHDRKSLVTSFKSSNKVLLTRNVRIDLHEQRHRPFFDNMNQGGQRRSFDRQGGRGNYRDNFSQRQQHEGGGFRGRNSGGYNNRDNRESGGFFQPANYQPASGGSGSDSYGGGFGGHTRPRPGPPPLQLPSQASQAQQPAGTANADSAHSKRVNEDVLKSLLQSVGNEEARDAKHNPFGAARPVDTLTKELEMEKRLEQERQVRAKQAEATSPTIPQEGRQRQSSTGSAQAGAYPQQQYNVAAGGGAVPYGAHGYGEPAPAWQQQQQQQQPFYEGQQPYAAEYQQPYGAREQQPNAWGNRQQAQQGAGYSAPGDVKPAVDKSQMECIGRTMAPAAPAQPYRGNGHYPPQPAQPAAVRHSASGSTSDYRETGGEQQMPVAQPIPKALQPAPIPVSNAWHDKDKKPAATVSAKTKQVLTTAGEPAPPPYYNQFSQDIGNQYNSEAINFPYKENDDEELPRRARQQQSMGDYHQSPRHSQDEQPGIGRPAPPPKAPAWGGHGIPSYPQQQQAHTPPQNVWSRTQPNNHAQDSQDHYQQQQPAHQGYQSGGRGGQEGRRSDGRYSSRGGRQQQRNFYLTAEAVQAEQAGAEEYDQGGEYSNKRGGRGFRGGARGGGRGGRGGGYRGRQTEESAEMDHYQQGDHRQKYGGNQRGQPGMRSNRNRNSGADAGDEYGERKRIVSTSSSQREHRDSHTGGLDEEGGEWNAVTKKTGRAAGSAGAGRSNYSNQPRKGRGSYPRNEQSGSYGGEYGGHRDREGHRDGKGGSRNDRTFYSNQRSGAEGAGGSGRPARGGSSRGSRGGAGGGVGGRGPRGNNTNANPGSRSTANAAQPSRQTKDEFEKAKGKKTSRPVSAKEAGVEDADSANRFKSSNPFDLLEEQQSATKQSGKPVKERTVDKDHFDGDGEKVEDEEDFEYEEVEEEVEVEVEEEEEAIEEEPAAEQNVGGTAASPSDIDYYEDAAGDGDGGERNAAASDNASANLPTSQGQSTAEVC